MIEHDGYWYPFMNEVASHNLGHGNTMENALDLVKDWSVAIDGGAQIGRVANRLAEKFEKVYAVEIATENYECLVKNKKPNVIPIHGCLGVFGRGYSYKYEPDKHPESPVYRTINDRGPAPGIRIDELGLQSCGFIKLDLQGYDYYALLGADHTLRRFKPVLYFEYDPSCFERYGVHKNAHEIFLTALGYRYHGTDDGNQIWA